MHKSKTSFQAMRCDPHYPGGLYLDTFSTPEPSADEILIRVHTAGVNPVDLEYGEHFSSSTSLLPIPGVEVAGEVLEVGRNVFDYKRGDRVMALLSAGGYAELCIAPAATTLPIPQNLSFEEAAALPEGLFTIWSNLFMVGHLESGEVCLIHGGTGGIGSLALQIAKLFGATVISTSRDEKRCSLCRNLGADYVINYSTQDFAIEVLRATDGKGVDVILDHVGSNYFPRHLELLKRKGRLILLDATSGEKCSLDLGKVITKHLLITGSTLRPRPLDEKQRISDAVKELLLPKVQAGLNQAPYRSNSSFFSGNCGASDYPKG